MQVRSNYLRYHGSVGIDEQFGTHENIVLWGDFQLAAAVGTVGRN